MQNIEEVRDKIYSLLGRHLIRFQTVEMRLKSLIKINRTIICKPNNPPLIMEPSVKNQTLGGLSTKALSSFFLVNPVEEETIIPKSKDSLRLDIKVSYNLCEHHHHKLNSQLQEFVKNRNFITHNFQEKYNLSNLDECKAAVEFLLTVEQKHKPFLDQLDQYWLATQKNLKTQVDFFKSNLFQTHLFFPFDEIYREVELLIVNNKSDGWISLTTVFNSINKKFPDANKKIKMEYDFKNLSDLILNSGLFLLKVEPTLKGERILIQINHGEAIFEISEN